MTDMNFGVTLSIYSGASEPGFLAEMGVAIEALGFDSIWLADHVVIPSRFRSRYPYSDDGRLPGGEDVPTADPLVTIAYLAACTRQATLGTGLLILPQRNPVVLAKEVATLDRLTGGRLALGVGVGWLREEYEAVGVPWEHRGQRMDDYIDAMRTLWREPAASHQGRFVQFSRAKLNPKPMRPEGVPIVIGGQSGAAARRAGQVGDAFYPYFRSHPKEIGPLVETMRSAASDAGRDPDAISIMTGTPRDRDGVELLADLGVSRLVIPPLALEIDAPTLTEKLARIRDRLLAGA